MVRCEDAAARNNHSSRSKRKRAACVREDTGRSNARSRTRTDKPSRTADFESAAFTSFAIRALLARKLTSAGTQFNGSGAQDGASLLDTLSRRVVACDRFKRTFDFLPFRLHG